MSGLFEWLASLFRGAKLWTIVQPWQRAVRVRLGKNTTVLEPGWHFRIPVADDVTIVNSRLRIYSFPCQTVTTKDGRTVSVAGMVGFRIVDPLVAMLKFQQPESTCAAFAQSAVAAHISERTLPQLSVDALENATAASVGAAMDGMDVEFVRVVDFAAVKTFRLLQEQWRPQTNTEA